MQPYRKLGRNRDERTSRIVRKVDMGLLPYPTGLNWVLFMPWPRPCPRMTQTTDRLANESALDSTPNHVTALLSS